MDIKEEESVRTAAEEVEKRFGRGKLRLMINVAGVVSTLLGYAGRS